MTTQFPCRFGKYLLLERISTGGMAEVFRAKSFGVAGFEKSFALKRILPHISEDPEFIAMFIDEAKIAARLHHANICQIIEFGRVGDYYFQVMEYISGCDLRKIRRTFQARGRTVPPEVVLLAIEKVCDGLDYAHRKADVQGTPMDIIHRDVSPQNILISFEGAVKLIDFGIAKAASRAAKTQAGQIKGKFSYLTPEQITGQALDARLDIFALGIVTWELLTGRDLFVAENEMEILRMILRANVPPPSHVNPSLPPELDHVVLQALATNPDDRYQFADEFMEEIQRVSYRLNLRISPTGVQRFMGEEFAEELALEQEKVKRFWDLSKETRLPESEESSEDPREQSVITFSGRRLRPPSERPSSWQSSKHITVIQGVASDSSETMELGEEEAAELASTRSTAAGDDIMELSDDDIEELLDEEEAEPQQNYGEPQEAEDYEYEEPEEAEDYEYEKPQEAEDYEYEEPQEAEDYEYEKPEEAEDHEYEKPQEAEDYEYKEPQEAEDHELQQEESEQWEMDDESAWDDEEETIAAADSEEDLDEGDLQELSDDEDATVYEGDLGPLTPICASSEKSDPSFNAAMQDVDVIGEDDEGDEDEGATDYESPYEPLTPIEEDYPGPQDSDEDWVITFNPQDDSGTTDEP